jgi:hypothetical protein
VRKQKPLRTGRCAQEKKKKQGRMKPKEQRWEKQRKIRAKKA